MPAENSIGAVGRRRQARDREPRRVRRQDRPGGCSPIEIAEDADLQLEALGHRLDHEIDSGGVFERAREREARQRGVGLLTRDLAPLDAPLQPVAPRRDVLATVGPPAVYAYQSD